MQLFETARNWTIKGLIFLLPLFFLPITGEYYNFNKLALFTALTLLGWLVWALSQIKHEFRLRVTPFDLPVLAIAIVFTASTILVSPNKFDALLFPGTATWIIAGTLFYFLVVQYVGSQRETGNSPANLSGLLLAGTALSALISTLTGVGAFTFAAKYVNLPVWATQPSFTTTGDLFSSITLYAVVAVLALARVIETKRTSYSPFNVILLVIVIAGLVASVYQGLPGKATSVALLPITSGWAIALETLKGNILLGVGPGNFIEAFNRFRPVEFNSSSAWALRFTSSSNWYLHVWTITGLAGIASFGWLVLTITKKVKGINLNPVGWALLATLVVFLLAPASLLLIFAFYLLLALAGSPLGEDLSLQFAARETGETGRKTNLLPGIIALLITAGIVGVGYWGSRAYAAEMSFRQALNAASQNDGKATYDAIIKASQLNPGVAQYRITASQTNLALANAIASKKDLTEEERQTVSQLVQQSIREAQAAVALHRTNAVGWENLARLYQSLMTFAKDADQFTIASYQQAVALDPVNPLLRVAFGGVYYSLKQFDNAVRTFELAVAAKPDLANAHYNLAVALREKGEIARAYQEMQATVALLKSGTPDYDKAKAEAEELQKKVAETSATPSAKQKEEVVQPPLEAPQPAPAPALEPKLDLPEAAAPPATESSEPTPVPVQ